MNTKLLLIGVLIFVKLNGLVYTGQMFCATKENEECKFKCHCETQDNQCIRMNGSCGSSQSDCAPGWIGPECQYSNIAYLESGMDKVRDGNYDSCSKQNNFTIDLQKHYPISSFTIFAKSGRKTIIKATVCNSTQDKDTHLNICVGQSKMSVERDFICTHTIVGRFLVVMFEREESVCEIGIHGGKNIALWQHTKQSGTLTNTNWNSDKAVDGNIGHYSINSGYCSHTAETWYYYSFWSVSFGRQFYIERIKIHFRNESIFMFRFADYLLSVINEGITVRSYKKNGTPIALEEIILTPPALGSNVTIRLPRIQSHQSNLNLCEVQVFACSLRPNAETCTNSCPVNCNVNNDQHQCNDYTCPENHCTGDWKGKYCNERECTVSELESKGFVINDSKNTKLYLSGSTNKVSVMCLQGYTMNGTGLVKCDDNGKWNLDTFCIVNTCMQPKDEHTHTNVTGISNVKFGTTVKITCDKGYHLKAPTVIHCQINGTWSYRGIRTAPICEGTNTADGNYLSGVSLGVAITSTVFIVILLIIGITLYMRRRRKQNDKTENTRQTQETNVNEKNVYCSIEETENESETTLTIDNSAIDKSGYYSFLPNKGISQNAIKIENFKNYVEGNEGNDGSIVRQFSNLLTGLQYPAKVACFQQNKTKNKYKNIYAYDNTRVVLHRSKEKSDYINASFINGYDSVKRYVASQGPIKGTEEDFWEMMYQLGSDKIVMLTNVYEEGKQKCVQYWPDEGCIKFGSMSVQLKSVDRYADFTIRHLSINEDGKERRNVKQFHFTSWPDKGVPKYASSLVQFRHKVLSVPTKGKGPLVVHCSAGIGRTGAFIALDILVSQARATGQVDVLACVETLRRQRVNMVQTAEQYLFLHHALEEALMCKTTATAAADFPEIYSRLQQMAELQRGIDKEFQTLNETSPVLQEEEFVSGKTTENKKKNRYSNILPVESHRIYIYSYIPGRSDYINAVMLPSYKESKAFIATQMPLPDTVVDFLCLVHDNDVSSIVMLNEMNDGATLGRYWPDYEDELKVGPFTVTKSSEEILDNVVIRQLKIQFESKETRIIKQFQVKFWPDCDVIPSSVSDVLTLMELVQNWQRKAEGYTPVVVHCMNGCDKTGLYCVVEATIERLKIEQDVGIQQIIKQMRSRRHQIIPCITLSYRKTLTNTTTMMEQFEFCHEAVLEFMHQNETYSNFQ